MSDDSDNKIAGTPENPSYGDLFWSWARRQAARIVPSSWIKASETYDESKTEARTEAQAEYREQLTAAQTNYTGHLASFRTGKNAQVEAAEARVAEVESAFETLSKENADIAAERDRLVTKNAKLAEENTALETRLAASEKNAKAHARIAEAQREKAASLVRIVETSRQMLDEIPKPALMIDPDLNIVRANKIFEEVFGYDPQQIERGKKDVPLSRIVSNQYNLKRLQALAGIFKPIPNVPLSFQIPLKMRPSDRQKSWGTNLWFGDSRYHIANAKVVINPKGEFVEAYLTLGDGLGTRDIRKMQQEFQTNRELVIGAAADVEYDVAEAYMRRMIHAYAFDFKDGKPKAELPASITIDMIDTKELLFDALYALRQMYMFCQSKAGRHMNLSFTNVPEEIMYMMKGADIAMVEQAPAPEAAKAEKKPVYVSKPIAKPIPIPL